MKMFSFLIWFLWGAIVARVLLAPYWGLTLAQGLVLLLVAAPAVGMLAWIGSLFRHAGRDPLAAAGGISRR